jgi:hypothetical protein
MTIETEKRFMRRYVVQTAAPKDEVYEALIRGLAMEKGHVVYIDSEPLPTRKFFPRALANHTIRWLFVIYGFVICAISLWEACKAAMQ